MVTYRAFALTDVPERAPATTQAIDDLHSCGIPGMLEQNAPWVRNTSKALCKPKLHGGRDMDRVEAEQDIKLIRDVMERSAQYTNFTGISGVIAGALALLGCALSYWMAYHLPDRSRDIWSMVTWVLVLAMALTQDLTLAQWKARKRGQTIWNPATYQVLRSIIPGVFVAFVLSLRAMTLHQYDAIPAIWCLGYGAAVCAAGRFSVREVRVFGVIQLISGAIGLFWFSTWDSSLAFLAVTFGLYHMVFGLVLMRKYGW